MADYSDLVEQVLSIKKSRDLSNEDIAEEMKTVRLQTVTLFLNQKVSKPHRGTLESFRGFVARNLKHVNLDRKNSKSIKSRVLSSR